ncbi:MAG: TatD family hydrolase [Glaciecola sp.]
MIDSHCHIDLPAFDHDRIAVLKAAANSGVERFLVPGLSNEQFTTLLGLQQLLRDSHGIPIDIALGLHPYFYTSTLANGIAPALDLFEAHAKQHRQDVVALGETGMDASIKCDLDTQETLLRAQLSVANQLQLPVILHHRQSHNHLIRILKTMRFSYGGLIHAFSGSAEVAKTYLDLGFLLGVGGTITYPRANKTRATIKNIPLEYLMLETDSPDMPLNHFQGQRNTPGQLPLVAEALAELKDASVDTVKEQTTLNYRHLFKVSE